jgi:hypothetical protein
MYSIASNPADNFQPSLMPFKAIKTTVPKQNTNNNPLYTLVGTS